MKNVFRRTERLEELRRHSRPDTGSHVESDPTFHLDLGFRNSDLGFCLSFVVFIDETMIDTIWFASSIKSTSTVSRTISDSAKSSSQYNDSSASSSTILNLKRKSAVDFARHAER